MHELAIYEGFLPGFWRMIEDINKKHYKNPITGYKGKIQPRIIMPMDFVYPMQVKDQARKDLQGLYNQTLRIPDGRAGLQGKGFKWDNLARALYWGLKLTGTGIQPFKPHGESSDYLVKKSYENVWAGHLFPIGRVPDPYRENGSEVI